MRCENVVASGHEVRYRCRGAFLYQPPTRQKTSEGPPYNLLKIYLELDCACVFTEDGYRNRSREEYCMNAPSNGWANTKKIQSRKNIVLTEKR